MPRDHTRRQLLHVLQPRGLTEEHFHLLLVDDDVFSSQVSHALQLIVGIVENMIDAAEHLHMGKWSGDSVHHILTSVTRHQIGNTFRFQLGEMLSHVLPENRVGIGCHLLVYHDYEWNDGRFDEFRLPEEQERRVETGGEFHHGAISETQRLIF